LPCLYYKMIIIKNYILWHGWRNRRWGSRELCGLARWRNKRFPPLRDNTSKHSFPLSDDVAAERWRCYEWRGGASHCDITGDRRRYKRPANQSAVSLVRDQSPTS
jgi:hypothetical protein